MNYLGKFSRFMCNKLLVYVVRKIELNLFVFVIVATCYEYKEPEEQGLERGRRGGFLSLYYA